MVSFLSANAEYVKELLVELLRIRSPSGEEEAISRFICDIISEFGYDPELIHISGRSYNVIVNNMRDPDLLIATHMDTVSLDIPISVSGNIIKGTGACDAKGSIVTMILTLMKTRIPDNISFAFFSDEEMSGSGSMSYLRNHKPKSVIILEPTELNVCFEGYGAVEGEIILVGRRIHPSVADRLQEHNVIGKLPILMDKLAHCFSEEGMKFVVYAVDCGSKEEFWLPSRCSIAFDILVPYGLTAKKCISILREQSEIYHFEYRVTEYSDPFRTTDEEFIRKVSYAYEKVFNSRVRTAIMPSWTDANNFAAMGIPVAVFGPGSLLYAHSEYERVNIMDIIGASRFLIELVNAFSNQPK